MDCGCKHGTKKVTGANAMKSNSKSAPASFGNKFSVATKKTKKATRVTFSKK